MNVNPLSRGLLRLFRFRTPLGVVAEMRETADFLEDDEAFEAALVEKKLTVIALVTALEATLDSPTESDRKAVRATLRSLYLPTDRTAMAENALMSRAGAELITYLVARLAVERGETPQDTWRREAENLSKILTKGNGP